jgi:glucokinase
MARRAAELLGQGAKTSDLFDAAKAGDPAATVWLTETQEYVAMALADMAALLDPEAVVFGGGVAMAQGEWFLGPVRDLALRCVPGKPRIILSSLGEDAQIIGAVRLALDRVRAG